MIHTMGQVDFTDTILFNSRTKKENDFISLDDDLVDDTRISDEFASALNAENEFRNLGFSQERTSMDKGIN